nr:uncharacterized protein LOC109157428 [Ipomoea batatas]
MQPNESSPARAAPPAASPRSLLTSPPQDIPPRSLTPAEPMVISPPNTSFGTFGATRSPFTPMQTMPTIMETLERTTRPPSSSHTSLPFSTQGRSLDPTVPRSVRSKFSQPELNSLDEWLGEGVQMMVPRDHQNMVEPLDNRVMTVHYHAIQGGLQFPPHPLTLTFLASHNIAPCQLTPNGYRFITCFITRCREVKVAPSLSLLLHLFHVNQSGPFLHLQPISGYSFVTSLPSLVKNWKEKFVYVSYNPGAAGYGFSIAWVQFVVPFAAPSYEGLDADRAKLCGDGPHDHRRYHDPLLANQLSDGPPLPVQTCCSSTANSLLRASATATSRVADQLTSLRDLPTFTDHCSSSLPLCSGLLKSRTQWKRTGAVVSEGRQVAEAGELIGYSAGRGRGGAKQAIRGGGAAEYDDLKTAHADLQLAHSTLQGEHEKQQACSDIGCPLLSVLAKPWQMPCPGEVWLRDTDEGHARVVRESEAAFYLGQREMQDQLYGKLRRRFTSFSIAGWKLPEYLPLRRPPAPVMPTSTTTPADGFLMSPERAGGTSSVALPSDPVGGSGVVESVDPSMSLHFTSGSGISGSAAGSAAP